MKPVFDSFTAPALDRRKLLSGLLFCGAAGVAAWRQPHKVMDYLGKEKLEDLVPKAIGRWKYVAASGLVIPPKDSLEATVYSQLLTRVYSDDQNEPIMLLAAQSGSQTGFLQIHRPEFCYTASGYTLSPSVPHHVQLGSREIPANSMDASAGGGPIEHIVYWTRIGDRMPLSWAQQKLAVAEENLKGLVPDAILVRVSMVSPEGKSARAVIDEFIRELINSVPAAKRSVFIA